MDHKTAQGHPGDNVVCSWCVYIFFICLIYLLIRCLHSLRTEEWFRLLLYYDFLYSITSTLLLLFRVSSPFLAYEHFTGLQFCFVPVVH